MVGRGNGRAAGRREGSWSSGWVSSAFKLPSDCPVPPGLWEKLREFFQTVGGETLPGFSGIWIKVPNRRPPFVFKLSNLLQGLFQAEECVILYFYELMELPLSKERGEIDQH